MRRLKNKPCTRASSVRGEKVIIAMSGGIDSSVAAALLKETGLDVIGIFMKLDKLKSSKENEKRAKAIAKKLNISFQVLDIRKEFEEKVIKPFIEGYKKGITPNPCVVCNKEIKFKFLFRELSVFNADYIATGHYARIKEGKLLKGRDKNRDQSYFLWQLNQKILRKTLFPVGGYTKSEVRKLAKEFKLPVLNIPESQEICFIQTKVDNFLKRYLMLKPGPIVEQVHYGVNKIIDTKGKIIGEHQGLWFYTIGQRKGIELPGGPFYVLKKDLRENILVVTKNEKDLYKKELIAKNIKWISGKAPKLPLKIKTKIRYKHKQASTVISKQKNGKIKVVFSKSQRAITPGQSVVFYLPRSASPAGERQAGKDQELLGGGIIN